MKRMRFLAFMCAVSLVCLIWAISGYGQGNVQSGRSSECLAMAQGKGMAGQQSHHEMVNQRGDQVMGFDHTKTTHHFRLLVDGGAIDVSANDSKDTESRDQIRHHLRHIAMMFADGDFSAPMLIHGQTPPGVQVMKRLKEDITYKFEETDRGGLVRITTSNAEAIQAVHDFLIFQIKDHRTGDSLEVEKN
jgi:hypothetical protein